jgi:hypothetical protein
VEEQEVAEEEVRGKVKIKHVECDAREGGQHIELLVQSMGEVQV